MCKHNKLKKAIHKLSTGKIVRVGRDSENKYGGEGLVGRKTPKIKS